MSFVSEGGDRGNKQCLTVCRSETDKVAGAQFTSRA